MTYRDFVKKNLPIYIRAGMTPTSALRAVARDWRHWKGGTARNPEIHISAIESRFRNYDGRRYVKDSIWDHELEANKRVDKLRSDGYLAEVVFITVGTMYNKRGFAYAVYKVWPKHPVGGIGRNPTRREAAITRYKKLENQLERTSNKRRAETLIRELGKLEIKYGFTREELYGRWKSGSPEIDKMIELSKKIKSNPKFSRERTSPQQEAHFRAEDEATIRWWVDEIRQAKDLIVRRKLIATMVGQAKKGAISTTIVGQVIKRARIHDEVDAMRLRKMINPSNGKLNSKLYESFHGVAPTRKVKVYYEPPPNELIAIGELKQINYKPIRGPRRDVEYYHRGGDLGERKIETNIILATDKAGKNLYLVRKNKNSKYPIFTERGIIG